MSSYIGKDILESFLTIVLTNCSVLSVFVFLSPMPNVLGLPEFSFGQLLFAFALSSTNLGGLFHWRSGNLKAEGVLIYEWSVNVTFDFAEVSSFYPSACTLSISSLQRPVTVTWLREQREAVPPVVRWEHMDDNYYACLLCTQNTCPSKNIPWKPNS